MWQQQEQQRAENEKNNQQINKILARVMAIMITNRKERGDAPWRQLRQRRHAQ